MNLLTYIPFWAWITISAVLFAFGEYLSKKFALNPGWVLFTLFIIVDLIAAAAWIPAIFQESQLSTTGVIWSIASLLATVLIGILVFGERLNLIQSMGIVAGIVCVVLLSR